MLFRLNYLLAGVHFFRSPQRILSKVEQVNGRKGLSKNATAEEAVMIFAKLGGYMGRNAGPPGQRVLWRAMMSFQDILLGARI